MEMIGQGLELISVDTTWYAAGVLARGATLLALTFVGVAGLRRAPAALRHHVWALAMVGLLALPLLSGSVPTWRVAMPALDALGTLVERTTADVRAARPSPADDRVADRASRLPGPRGGKTEATASDGPVTRHVQELRSVDRREAGGIAWPAVLLTIWAAGALVLLGRLAAGLIEAARLVRRARPVTDRRWSVLVSLLSLKTGLEQNVRVVQSAEVNVPMAWGLLDAWLVLPEGIENWPDDRRRVVVLHELAHLRRRDCLVQAFARVALALHWPNPLAWVAVRRMCSEREQACDDAVLAAGVGGPAYAHHLVDIARGLTRAARPARAAVAMARPSELENRVLAILDDRRSRRSVGRRVARLGLVGFGLVVLTVASIRPTAAATEGAGFDATLEGERATTGEPVPIPRAVTDPAAEGPAVETVTDPEAAGETGFADGAPPIEPPSVGPIPQEAASDTIEERVLAALTRALRSEDPRVRRQAANTLGAIESPRAVEALASVVRSDDTPAVRREAAWALGMIESADAVDALAAAVRDTDGGVREKAVWALGMIESEAGVPALAAAAGDADPDVRAQVAWAIGMIEARSGVEPLLALLEDPESDVRDQAAWGLGMIESADAVAGLNRAFAAEADADVRAQILWALGMIEDRGGIDTVIDGLEDDDPDVREKALWALGMIMS